MRKITVITILTSLFVSALSQTSIDRINYLILTQKYAQALELNNRMIKNNSDSAHYFYQRALINKLMYRYPEALRAIKTANTLDINNIDYLE